MPPCKVRSVADYDVVMVPADDDELSYSEQSMQEGNHDSNTPTRYYHDPILKQLYAATVYLCYAMVFWIMIAPASWLISRSRFHREVIIPLLLDSNFFFLVAPDSIITKYQGHDMVHFFHLIPGAIWAALVPLQLHPTWRNQHRTLHRRLGYLFLACTLSMTAGIFIIFQRKLTYEQYFPDLEPHWFHQVQTPFQGTVALWFVYTALQAVLLARAKKIQQHQKWMIRHVASGIWISMQRMVFFGLANVYFKLTFQQTSSSFQRDYFAIAGDLSWLICVVLGEYAHKRMAGLQAKKFK